MKKLAAIKEQFLESDNKDWVVITHKDCMDGLGVALVALAYTAFTNGREPEIIFCQYGDKVKPEEIRGKHVILADFSFEEEELLVMDHLAETFVMLDHHDTPVKKGLDKLPFVYLDQTRSGARLMYQYIHDVHETIITADHDIPYLIRLIEDRDLWNWKYSDTRAAYAMLKAKGNAWAMQNSTLLVSHNSALLDEQLTKYNGVIEYQDQIIEKHRKKIPDLKLFDIAGYQVPCINSTHLISEIGNALAGDFPFSVQYFFTDKEIVLSLRSVDKVNVADLALKFGGGGHPNAAGFSIPLDKFNYREFFVNNYLVLPEETVADGQIVYLPLEDDPGDYFVKLRCPACKSTHVTLDINGTSSFIRCEERNNKAACAHAIFDICPENYSELDKWFSVKTKANL